MKKLFLFILIFIYFNSLFAQTKKSSEIGFTGQLMISYDGDATYFNIGGPSITYNLKNAKLGAAMYPSLRFRNDALRPFVTPILGTGLFYNYKKWLVALPLYFIANENKWKLSIGLGYKL